MKDRITSAISDVYMLFPDAANLHLNRRHAKRAWLPFLGRILKTVAGTASQEDVETLQKRVQILAQKTEDSNSIFQEKSKEMSSLMVTNSKRVTEAVTQITANHDNIRTLLTDITNIQASLKHNIQITKLFSEQARMASDLNFQFSEFVDAIALLKRGHLSPVLIPPSVLQQTIHHIVHSLHEKYPNLYLQHVSPDYYYDNSDFLAMRSNTSLYVTLRFPISSQENHMSLFKVTSFPLPLNATSHHATVIANLPDSLVMTPDLRFYASLPHDIWSTCPYVRHTNTYYCFESLVLQSTSVKCVCLSSLP